MEHESNNVPNVLRRQNTLTSYFNLKPQYNVYMDSLFCISIIFPFLVDEGLITHNCIPTIFRLNVSHLITILDPC